MDILQISNHGIPSKANPHDGTRGRWTFIPAEDKILVKDEVKNKVYELNMTEITADEFINNGGDVTTSNESVGD